MESNELCRQIDGRVWAEEFCARVKENPEIATDVECMHSWFANAIMAGYDHKYFQSKEYKRMIRRVLFPWWKRMFIPLSNFGR